MVLVCLWIRLKIPLVSILFIIIPKLCDVQTRTVSKKQISNIIFPLKHNLIIFIATAFLPYLIFSYQ